MEKSKKPPSAQELLIKIQEMEQRQAHIKKEISKLKLSANISKHGHQTACSHQITVGRPGAFQEVNRVTHVRVMGPLATKLIETQYLNILHSMGQAVYLYNYKDGIIFWNRAAENLYGYTAAEAYGKNPIDLIVEPKDVEMAEQLLERMAHGENWSGAFPVYVELEERTLMEHLEKLVQEERWDMDDGSQTNILSSSMQQDKMRRVSSMISSVICAGATAGMMALVKSNGRQICSRPRLCGVL